MARPALTDAEWWDRVDKDSGHVPKHMPGSGSCWLWTGRIKRSNGGLYGYLKKNTRAWHWTWEQENGPVPDGMILDHLCRVTLCVQPSHLEPVTNRVNILRGDNTAARHARKTHCIHGHPFSGENTYVAASGQRMCRTCRRRWEQERKARLRVK